MNNLIGILVSVIILVPSFLVGYTIIDSTKVHKKTMDLYDQSIRHCERTYQAAIYTTNEIRENLGMCAIERNKPKYTNCPNCGAPVNIHSDKCEYCGTPYVEKLTLTDGEYLTVKLETESLARALDQCRLNDYAIKALERTGRGF